MGLAILAAALGAYAIARETSIFALDRVEVHGGSPQIDVQVKHALAPLLGTSLVGLSAGAVLHRVDALPTVVSATYDRAFPHTLRVTIVPERPIAVLRRGARAWLVSDRGRVIEALPARGEPAMPRIWLGASRAVRVGEVLPAAYAGATAKALALAGAFRTRVAAATLIRGQLVFHLRSGIELLLGSPSGIRLKVAVAAQALRALPAGSRFLDVSTPGRAVAGTRLPPVQTSSRG